MFVLFQFVSHKVRDSKLEKFFSNVSGFMSANFCPIEFWAKSTPMIKGLYVRR